MYTLSNSRQNFDIKYQVPKHNMHLNLLFFHKFACFRTKVCENNRCCQRNRKASSSSTSHSLPGMICWVSENHRRNLFRAIETKNADCPFCGRCLSFNHLPIFRSHVRHYISSVYLKFLTLSATNSQLLMKYELSERQFFYVNHAEKV